MNILKTTEFYTLRWWVLCFLNLISIKIAKKKFLRALIIRSRREKSTGKPLKPTIISSYSIQYVGKTVLRLISLHLLFLMPGTMMYLTHVSFISHTNSNRVLGILTVQMRKLMNWFDHGHMFSKRKSQHWNCLGLFSPKPNALIHYSIQLPWKTGWEGALDWVTTK